MAEINVVPYIDVMLVMLVIFMITAPMLSQGVKVDLPQAPSKPLKNQKDREPIILSVDRKGDYYLNIGENPKQSISEDTLVQRVAAVLRRQPGTPVYVKGDKKVDYGQVVRGMALLQGAGAPSVGLMTEAPKALRKKRRRRN